MARAYRLASLLSFGFRLLLIAMLMVVSGSHWGMLRSYAWLTMTVQYTQELGVLEAASRAVEGEDPCKVCQFVTKATQAESQTEGVDRLERFDLRNEFQSVALFPAKMSSDVFRPQSCSPGWIEVPTAPPPRIG